MVDNVKEMKEFLDNIENKNIKFRKHFYDKMKADRKYLNESLVINSLKNTENLQGFQKQIVRGEERYRIGIKLSSNYNLVVIAKIINKDLYIISAWKTNRKWEKAIQK